MAKVIVSQGKILSVTSEKAVFTALKESEGSDTLLTLARQSGKTIFKMPQSTVNHLAESLFQPQEDLVSLYQQ